MKYIIQEGLADLIMIKHGDDETPFRNPSKEDNLTYIEPLNKVLSKLNKTEAAELYEHVTDVDTPEAVYLNFVYFATNKALHKAIYDVVNALPHPDLPETFIPEDNPAGYSPAKTWLKSQYPDTLKEIIISKLCYLNSLSLKSLVRVKRTLLNTLIATGIFETPGWHKIYKYIEESSGSENDFLTAALQQGLSKRQLQHEICWNVFHGSMPRLSLTYKKDETHHVVHQIINYIKSNIGSRLVPLRIAEEPTGDGVDIISTDVTTRDIMSTVAMCLDTDIEELAKLQELTNDEFNRAKTIKQVLLKVKPHISPINEMLITTVIKQEVHLVDLEYEQIINLCSVVRVILERHEYDPVIGDIMPQLIALSTSGITIQGGNLNNLGNNNTLILRELSPGLSSLEFNTDPAFKRIFASLADNVLVDCFTGETVSVYNIKVACARFLVNLDIIYIRRDEDENT